LLNNVLARRNNLFRRTINYLSGFNLHLQIGHTSQLNLDLVRCHHDLRNLAFDPTSQINSRLRLIDRDNQVLLIEILTNLERQLEFIATLERRIAIKFNPTRLKISQFRNYFCNGISRIFKRGKFRAELDPLLICVNLRDVV